MPIISQIEDFIIAPTLPADAVPLSTVSVLSPGFIRVPQKECTPIDCWAEECEKYYEADWFRMPEINTDAQPEQEGNEDVQSVQDIDIDEADLVDLVDLEADEAPRFEVVKSLDDRQSAWEVETTTSTTMSVTTINSPHVTAIFRHNPYDVFNCKHEMFRCPCNACVESYNYGPMESHPSYGNTVTPHPESQSFMFAAQPEQQYNVSPQQKPHDDGSQQQQQQQPLCNDQQNDGHNSEHPVPQVEACRPYIAPEEPQKFVPPPPPPFAAYEIFLEEYDSIYKDEIDDNDEQQVEEKKQRCRSYGLHLQYRSAMRWFERLDRCQLQWVSKDDPCPVPTPEVADSPACFLEWNRAAHQWWVRWFEHAQKKCSPLGIGAMKRSSRNGAFATHRGEAQSAKGHKRGYDKGDQSGYDYHPTGKSTTFRAQRAAVSASLHQAEAGSRRPTAKYPPHNGSE